MFGHGLHQKKSEPQFFTFKAFYNKKPYYMQRDEGYRQDVRHYVKQAIEGMKVYRKIDYKASPDIYKWSLKAVYEDLHNAKKFYDGILLDHPENEALRISYEKAWAKFEKLKRMIQSKLVITTEKKVGKSSQSLCIDLSYALRMNEKMITEVAPVFASAAKSSHHKMFKVAPHVAKEEKKDLVQFRNDIKHRSDLVVSLFLDLRDVEIILNLMVVDYKMLSALELIRFALYKQRLIQVIENNLQSNKSLLINQQVVAAVKQETMLVAAQKNIGIRHILLNDLYFILERMQGFLVQLITNYNLFEVSDLILFASCKKGILSSILADLKAPDPFLSVEKVSASEEEQVSLNLK